MEVWKCPNTPVRTYVHRSPKELLEGVLAGTQTSQVMEHTGVSDSPTTEVGLELKIGVLKQHPKQLVVSY